MPKNVISCVTVMANTNLIGSSKNLDKKKHKIWVSLVNGLYSLQTMQVSLVLGILYYLYEYQFY